MSATPMARLHRALERYRAGKIDGDTLAKAVDMYLTSVIWSKR